jgi:riboflavin-specific deaminase-like protein
MLNAEHWSDERPWIEIVAARRDFTGIRKLEDNSLWPLYGPCVAGGTGTDSFVIAQLGQSLDGRIATLTGHSHYINGPGALVHLHRLRALADAVIVGVSTVLADNPRLTVRHAAGPQPARVIIDPRGRLTGSEGCLTDSGSRRIVLCRDRRDRRASLPGGVELLEAPSDDTGRLPPAGIVATLAEAGLRSLLVEGGAFTVSAFMTAGMLDRLHILFGPMIIGSGPAGLSLPEIATLDEAIRPTVTTYNLPEGDFLVDCAFDRQERTAR